MTSINLPSALATVAAANNLRAELASAPAPTKQQLRDAQLREKRAAKAAAKAAQKAATTEKRANGVIGTIRTMLDRAQGTTRAECLAVLTEKFADRDPMGMVVTVGIQFSRLAQSTGRKIENYKVEGRGRVYGFADVLVRPEVVAVGTAEVAAPTPAAPAEVEPAKVVRRVQGAKPGRESK